MSETKPKATRTPQPLYLFASVNAEGKIVANKTFRKPIDMANYMAAGLGEGEQLVVVAPAS